MCRVFSYGTPSEDISAYVLSFDTKTLPTPEDTPNVELIIVVETAYRDMF
jgi:hypothetical protein